MRLCLDKNTRLIESLKSQTQRVEKSESEIEEKLKLLQSSVAVLGSSNQVEMETIKNQLMEYKAIFEKELASKATKIEFAGFHARIISELEVKSHARLNCFALVSSLVGNCYSPETGCFTAPHSGQYVVSISLDITTPGVNDALIVKRDNRNKESVLSAINASVPRSNASAVCLVEMFKMEEIYIIMRCNQPGTKLSYYSTFSCFSI
ncbi:hypothetical protein Btru_017505 [Bulinus truncatus]|nr:hypothetical protein Btru_017505 [Bulinus truncatus]